MHVITPSLEEWKQTRLFILNNTNEVLPYIVRHKALVRENNPKVTKNRVLKRHKMNFLNWFQDTIFGDHNASETLRKLADRPKINVSTSQRYDIDKYSFYIKSQDDKSTVQNSGVSLKVESQYFAIINDDNPRLASMPLESLKKYGNLIMLNSLCVFLSVSGLITILVCGSMIPYLLL